MGAPEEVLALQAPGFAQLTRSIEDARTIVLGSHTSPDGDALGSELCLAALIRNHWPEKRVACLLADPKGVPRHLAFLPGAEELRSPEGFRETPDLFIAVDLSVASRLACAQGVMERAKEVYVLDHHPTEHPFGTHGMTRADAAATGVMVLEYALYLGEPLDAAMATQLFCAVMTDTGRFQYQNANAEAFWAASELVAAGANPSEVALPVYQSMRLCYLHLESIVMGRIATRLGGRIAYSWVLWEDFEATGCGEDEAEGLVDSVRCVEGSEVALLLRQTPEGSFRGNLRSKGALDVSGVALELGGGGHAAAAGFTLGRVSLEEALERTLPLLEALVAEGEGTLG